MNRIVAAVKETAKWWGLPVAVAFVVELITNKEEK